MLIKNAIIHDAVNPQPYEGDLALREGRIAAVGGSIQPLAGEETPRRLSRVQGWRFPPRLFAGEILPGP